MGSRYEQVKVYVPGHTARRVCEMLAAGPEMNRLIGMTASELAKELEVAYSTMKAHLVQLCDAGYLKRQGAGRWRNRFVLGMRPCPPAAVKGARSNAGRPRTEKTGDTYADWPCADPVVEGAMRAMARCPSFAMVGA